MKAFAIRNDRLRRSLFSRRGARSFTAAGLMLLVVPIAQAQQPMPKTPGPAAGMGGSANVGATAQELLHVPVGNIQIGGVKQATKITNPVADDPEAVQRGMQYFIQFNCIGCHMPNGTGGMGPALSNHKFIYGGEAQNIFLTILQGRPKGMPAWGARLPDHVIWDLVAYIRKGLSQAPAKEWGLTVSANSPAIEQVPMEFQKTATPWKYTEPFSFGQKPMTKLEGKKPATPQ